MRLGSCDMHLYHDEQADFHETGGASIRWYRGVRFVESIDPAGAFAGIVYS